jgi:hypothetical protein
MVFGVSRLLSGSIITTIYYQIPPNLPFTKGGIAPLRKRGARGDFINISSQYYVTVDKYRRLP